MRPQRRLLLTRPRQQAGAWAASLTALGVDVAQLPLIEIAAAADPAEAQRAWTELPQSALAMFVSPNAVAEFFAWRPTGAHWPTQTLAATVGPGSAKALLEAGVPSSQIVQPADDAPSLDSEHLWPRLSGLDWQGRLALVLRGEGGRDWLGERLCERGAEVRYRSVYQRRCAQLQQAEQEVLNQALAWPAAHVWLFSSSEAVDCLQQRLAPQADWSSSLCVATHARIAARAQGLGFGHVVLARPQPQAVAQALMSLQT